MATTRRFGFLSGGYAQPNEGETPSVKAITARLKAYLDTRPQQVIAPDCFTLILPNTNTYRWTNADVPVVIYRGEDADSGVLGLGELGDFTLGDATGLTPAVFSANGVRIQGLKASQKCGLDVDEQDVTVYCSTPDYFLQSVDAEHSGVLGDGELGSMVLGSGPQPFPEFGPSAEMIEGLPFLWALSRGLLDDATIIRETAFLPRWGSPAIGSLVRFHGVVSSIDKIGYSEATLKVKSDLVRLDTPFPRNIYQPTCIHVLFDEGCTLDKEDFGESGTVGSSTTTSVIHWSSGRPTGYFDQGTVTFTSGALNGLNAGVKFSDGTTLTMMDLLPVTPLPGDTFDAFPGCDHTPGAGGCAKFNNLAHYRGYPRVPPPVTAA